MSSPSSILRRALLGRPVASSVRDAPRLGRWRALQATSSNALSSLAYAPDEIILTLVAAGGATLWLGPFVGWAVVAVMVLTVLAFRAAVVAVPQGGIHRMARIKLGPRSGVLAAAALLLDFVFTAAVSVAAFAHHLSALVPAVAGLTWLMAGAALVVVLLSALRGGAERSLLTPVVVTAFVALLAALVAVGLWQDGQGRLAPASTAGLTVADAGLGPAGGIATALLALRAFGAGSVLLTGVEVPLSVTHRMARPAVRTVRWVLAALALVVGVLTVGVMHLAQRTGAVVALDPSVLRRPDGSPLGPGEEPGPVLAQLADAVFGPGSPGAVAVIAVTCLLLLVAARGSFHSFPALASRLAEDGYLPRQLRVRGDRMVHTWGVLALGAGTLLLLVVFRARTALLVQLYVIGVLLAFTLALVGMVRLWRRRLAHTPGARARASVRVRYLVTAVGLAVTGLAGVVVLVTRFQQGAWVALLAILLGARHGPHPSPLPGRRRRARPRPPGRRAGPALPGARRGRGLHAEPARPAGPGLRPRHPPLLPRGGGRGHRPAGHRAGGGGLHPGPTARPADRGGRTLPGHRRPAGAPRALAAQPLPAGPRHGVHPRARGAARLAHAAAQPHRHAPDPAAAARGRCDGRLGPVADPRGGPAGRGPGGTGCCASHPPRSARFRALKAPAGRGVGPCGRYSEP